jgi:hypothetical protein
MVFFSIMNLLDVVKLCNRMAVAAIAKGKQDCLYTRELWIKETGDMQRLCRSHVENFYNKYLKIM